jgi:pentatricopeptide repeat protein
MSQAAKTSTKTHNPVFTYLWASGAIFSVLLWANHIFHDYRIIGNNLFAMMPIVTSVIMGLWLILLADELLCLLESSGTLSRIIKVVKILSFGIIILYGAMALALWVNGISHSPAITKKTKIHSAAAIQMGPVNYGHVTVTGWNGDGRPQKILGGAKDDPGLNAGSDVEIVTRKGILSWDRVLEIRRDQEKYYFKMLKAAPDSRTAIIGLIEIYGKRKEFEKAKEWFDQLQAKYPGEIDIGYDLAAWLIEDRRYEPAADILKKLSELKKDYETVYLLGQTLTGAGKTDEAEKVLMQATELDPTDFRAFYRLGYVYRDMGKNEKAKEAWARVLTLFPHFSEVERNIKNIEKIAGN